MMDKYKCDVCDVEMDIFEVGYLGTPLENKSNRCDEHMKMDCFCHKCYTDKMNKLGKNPNDLSYNERN
tara:strand:- start:80 stop:283 length:204 start_codon:yes stop_codon:yes gene_type:complete